MLDIFHRDSYEGKTASKTATITRTMYNVGKDLFLKKIEVSLIKITFLRRIYF